MKSIKIVSYCTIAGAFLLSICFVSCQKESVSKASTIVQSLNNEDDVAAVSKTVGADGIAKLVLRPGSDGQDTYITFLNSNPDWANGTGDFAQELSMQSWTYGGALMGVRSYLKFKDLDLVPLGAEILSAKLYLYAKGSSISNPNGNSGYSGSPYSMDNACKVERVTGGAWDESTLTWNTQPAITVDNAAKIPASSSQWSFDVKVDVTNMVKAMAANPATNYGFRISLINETIYRSMIFASSENTNPKLRPKLVIQYQ